MFRNFYAEQKMTDPRDSWYKPNLLYNIHYRPPKSPIPPKMMVVTKEFNPSVCSCGEHGCKPHYRMEREVVWSNKEVKKEEDRKLKEKVDSEIDQRKVFWSGNVDVREVKGKLQIERTVKAQLKNTKDKSSKENALDNNGNGNDDVDIGNDEENDVGWKSDSSSEVKVDGAKSVVRGMNDVKRRMSSLTAGEKGADKFETSIIAQGGHLTSGKDMHDASKLEERRLESKVVIMEPKRKQKDNESDRGIVKVREVMSNELMEKIIQDDSFIARDASEEKEMFKKENVAKDLVQVSADVMSKGNTLKGLPRLETLTNNIPGTDEKYVPSTPVEYPRRLTADIEDFGSAFGIMSVFCDSELHAAWNAQNEFHGQ